MSTTVEQVKTAFKPTGFKLEVRNTSTLDASQAHILIFGKTKAGKTSTAVTLEEDPKKNGIICTQPEEQLAHLKKLGIPYVVVENMTQLDAALADPAALFPDMTTLIIDDFSEACEFKRAQAEAQQVGSKDTWAAYRSVIQWSDSMMRKLMAQPYNLVCTCFERGLKDEASTLSWIGPDMPPSTAEIVMSKFDFILHLENYKLLTQADKARRIIAGSRIAAAQAGKMPAQVEPNLLKLWTLAKQLNQ